MPVGSTTYDVNVRYTVEDRASSGMGAITREADAAAAKVGGLGSAVRGLAATLAGGFALHEAKKAFIGFNDQIEQAKVGVASITKMFNQDMSFSSAMDRADTFFAYYQEQARRSSGTTMDFIEMHKAIAPALEKAGASMKDFKTITTGATTSAPIFGERADVVALDIKQMIAGTVGARDRVATTLLASLGIAVDEFNKKAKSDPQYAIDVLNAAFSSKGLQEARGRIEHTFQGALSTLQDNLQIGLGKAGQPLFEAVRTTLNDVNEWIDKHPAEIAAWSEKVSTALMDGFHAMKFGVEFVVNHKDEIADFAKIFLALKGVGFVGSQLSAGASALAGSVMGLADAANAASKVSFGTFVSNLTMASTALMGLYTAATVFADWVDRKHSTFVDKQGENTALVDKINRANTILPFARGAERSADGTTRRLAREDADQALGTIVETIHQWGAFTKDAAVDWAKFREKGMDLGLNASAFQALGPLVDEAFKRFTTDASIRRRLGLAPDGTFDKDESKRRAAAKTQVNVTISKVEVASPDPDRFAFGLDRAVRRVAQNPTAARDALRDL